MAAPRRLSALAFALALTLPAFAGTPASELALEQCVVMPQPAKAGSRVASAVTGWTDTGNVTVMQVTGDYGRGQTAPRQDVAKTFFAAHPDDYDFLVTFTTFEFDTGDATAFYNAIRNDVQGIGDTTYDYSEGFGSAGKLQGYIDMAATSRYGLRPHDPGYESALNVLAHELMHRWGSRLRYRDGDDSVSDAMLGRDGVHWSWFLDSDASVMYGSDWRQRQDGRYEATAVSARYGALDLYAAGFAAPGEVPPVTLIRNGDGVATDLPRLGAVSGGQGETITIGQIVDANGERVPSAADSPKEFRAAFLLLTRPGETVTPELLYTLEAFRVRFQQRFAQMTDGRARLRIFTESKNAAGPALPVVLAGSGNAATPPGVAAAVAWLESRQQADGHWQDRAATAMRDTVAALRALEQLAPQSPAIARAREWIASRTVASTDAQAWQYLATGDSAQRDALVAAQPEDGGWGLAKGHPATPFDTALVGDLVARRADAATVDAALGRLVPQQNADGSFGATAGGRGRLLPTLHAARVLGASAEPVHRGAATRAGAWLDTRRIGNGYGQALTVSLPDTIELYSMLGEIPLADSGVVGARAFVRDRQQTAGDWAGSVYLTATAALATARDQRTNLAVSGSPTATPTAPAEGERVTLAATASNNGGIAAPATVARWYDGDPDQGGTRIGGDIAVPALLPGERRVVQTAWETAGRAGAHVLHLVLDADGTLAETREDDNRATLAVTVGEAPAQADLQLLAADLVLDPASVAQLPATVHLRGVVRNLGRTAVAGARFTLHAVSAPAAAVAQAVLDVPAQGTAPMDLAFTVASPAALAFVLRADPDNAIAEAREDNNEARVTLAFGEAIDLEVTADDVTLDGPAVAGRDVNFRVAVHNRGTVDSPPAVLRVDLVQGASTTTLFDGPVQAAAGATAERRLTWRAGEAGSAQLRVTVDPAGQVAESREDNNSAQRDFEIVAADRPDLAVVPSSLEFVPTPALQGAPVVASLRVRNYGQDVSTPFVVGVYAGDPRLGAARLGATTVAGLAGSAETTVAVNVASLDVYGTPTLYAFVDADAAVTELDETNNLAVKPLEVLSLPDVAVSVAGVVLTPALPVQGEAVTARVTVRNLGQQDARNVVVRLAEGEGATAATVSDKTIATLAAGASVDLEWQWTFGQQRAVTVTADPGDVVHELSEDNNRATLPVDVQNGNLFTSERYLSPNGDGVRDATAIVFRRPAAGEASVTIVSGLGHVVRRYEHVATNGEGRGQVIWDGRNTAGRIAVDGDYRVIVADANGPVGELVVTVDNNRSSVLEAIGTRYAIGNKTYLPPAVLAPEIPPAASAFKDYLYGAWTRGVSPNPQATGLYRGHTLHLPDVEPIVSTDWVVAERGDIFDQGSGVLLSPGGREAAFTLVDQFNSNRIRIFRVPADGSAAPVAVPLDMRRLTVVGYFDDNELLVRDTSSNEAWIVDTRTNATRPFRLPESPSGNGDYQVTPYGVYALGNNWHWSFVSRGGATPEIELLAWPYPQDGEYWTATNADGSRVLVYVSTLTHGKLDLVDVTTGTRRTVYEHDKATTTVPEIFGNQVLDAKELQVQWIDARNEFVVVDARARRLLRFNTDGFALGDVALPRAERNGDYGSGVATFLAIDAPEVQNDTRCGNQYDRRDGRSVYDPSTASLYLELSELVVVPYQPALKKSATQQRSGEQPRYNRGIVQFVRVDLDSGDATTVREVSGTELELPADAERYEGVGEGCSEILPRDWPVLILGDGTRLLHGGEVLSPARGIVEQPADGAHVSYSDSVWPGESRMSSFQSVATSLLNGFALIESRAVGESFELTGVAADRNFAYYELDYALASQPGTWHALTPASADEVLADEFLTWAPPQAGSYVVRLRVIDRAGNATTATTTVNARRGADIDGFGMPTRHFSPNGDGVKDAAIVDFRVRQAATLVFQVEDASGAVVHRAEQVYGQGDIGRHSLTWDGRNDAGGRAPDGRYRLALGGFGAWVVLDTVAPSLDATLSDIYGWSAGKVTADARVRADASDANGVTLSIDAVSALDGGTTSLLANSQYGYANVELSPSMYATSSFRVAATDLAGNTAARSLARGEQRLVLSMYRNRTSWFMSAPYQRLPLADDAPTVDMEPLQLDEGDSLAQLMLVPGMAGLETIAVQAAPLDEPGRWTELRRGLLASCNDCWDASHSSVNWLLDSQGLARGKSYRVRVMGERADGTRVFSNHIKVQLGGLAPPECPVGPTVVVADYTAGTLRKATLRYTQTNGPLQGEIAATQITPDSVLFNVALPEKATYQFDVEAIDEAGYPHFTAGATCNTGGGGGNGGEPGDGGVLLTIGTSPFVDDRCEGTPSGALRLRYGVKAGEQPVPRQLRWRYTNGNTLQEVTTAPFDFVKKGEPLPVTIDTRGWFEGSYPVTLEGSQVVNGQTYWAAYASGSIPVELAPPEVAISLPQNGVRVCANLLASTMEGSVLSPSQVGYRLSIGAGAAPLTWRCLADEGINYVGQQPDAECLDFSAVESLDGRRVVGRLWNDFHPDAGRELPFYNGAASLQLKAFNASGGTVCAATTVRLDSDVEVVERERPGGLWNVDGSPVIALAPDGVEPFRRARVLLRANESVDVRARVYDAGGAEIEVLRDTRGLTGDIDIEWNGGAAPDGRYEIRIEAADSCGQTKTFKYPVLLKNAPPAVAIVAPAGNATVAAAVVNVQGTVDDALLRDWTLDVALGATPGNAQILAQGTWPMRAGGGTVPTLGNWSRGQATGAATLRLRASDRFGNVGEALVAVTLDTPAHLIAAASVNPSLFSPNGDGVLDLARVQLNLLREANVALRVLDAAAQPVAVLHQGTAAAGTLAATWDGRNGAAAWPDGDYAVQIDAIDPQGTLSPEQATLAVTVDATAPAIALAEPVHGHVRPGQPVRYNVTDAHMAGWEASLARDGAVIASAQGTASGVAALTVPEDAQDGPLVLRVAARDAAGNRAERVFDLTLDRTAPVVALTAPADAAVVPKATATTIKGSVNDAHLASYTLSVAPAGSDAWQVIATGDANVDDAALLAWTPNLADGDYRLRLLAADRAGNTGEAIRRVTVDGTPPVAAITAPVDDAWVKPALTVQGTASDAHFSHYRLSLVRASAYPAGPWSDVYVGQSPVDAGALATLNLPASTGDYVVRLTVTDLAGLTATDDVRVRLDGTPPPAPTTLTGRVADNRDAVLDWLPVTADDLAGYFVYRGGVRITASPISGTHYVDTGAPEGTPAYHVVAVDLAGNESLPSNTVTLTVDRTPPRVTLTRPVAGERVRGAVDIAGSAHSSEDFHEYRLSVEPVAPAGPSRELARGSLPVPQGVLATWNTVETPDETRVRVRLDADDTNGNAASAQVEVVVDNLPPAAPAGLLAGLATASGAPCIGLGGDGRDVRVCWNPNTEIDLLGYLVYRDGKLVNAPNPAPSDLRPFALHDASLLDKAVADGVHVYVVHAIDQAGNISAPSDPASTDPLDAGPPHLTFVRPAADAVFERSLDLFAVSDDRDIARVQFAFRRVGNLGWIDIGTPLTAEPYRVQWTPGSSVPYGDYEIVATATDNTGRTDPNPPVVRVRYADLTAPPAPATLAAIADGPTVALTWAASDAADLAGYRLQRSSVDEGFWDTIIGNDPITGLAFGDEPGDGEWHYRVIAVDTSDNRSTPSNVAVAHVFSLDVAQPFTPTTQAEVALAGSTPRGGMLNIHVENSAGATDLPPVPVAAGDFAAAPIALAAGENHFELSVTDTLGHRSIASALRVTRGAMPAVPTGLAATVTDHRVDLAWNANTESDLAGYRVFRRGNPVLADRAIAEPLTATSDGGSNPDAAVDGDPQTAWTFEISPGPVTNDENLPALTVGLPANRLVTSVNLAWLTPEASAGNVDLQAWSGHAWITIASVRGAVAAQTLAPAAPYRTDRLRVVVLREGAGDWRWAALAEVQVSERPLVDVNALSETVLDGRYDYRVSAVSLHGFESARSDAVTADVGDAVPPDAVVLSGTLVNADAELSWTASASADVARYEVRRNGTAVGSVPATEPRTFRDAGLANGTYRYTVVALDAYDNASEPSNTVTLTVAEAGPGVPRGLTVTAPPADATLDIAWTAGDGAAAATYVVRRALAANGPFVEITRVSATTHRDAPLAVGTRYHYTVDALDARGNASGQSAPVSGIPRRASALATPLLTWPTVSGQPLVTTAAALPVCGRAEPGSTVTIDRDGVVAATAVASTEEFWDERRVDRDGTLVFAPDGVHYAWTDNGSTLRIAGRDGASPIEVTQTGKLAQWGLRGYVLYYVEQADGAIVRVEPGRAGRSLGIAIGGLRAYAVSPDETRIAFAGSYGASPQDGAWIANVDGSDARRIDSVEMTDIDPDGLHWSADGERLLVSTGTRLTVVTRNATVVRQIDDVATVQPAWSPDGRFVYAQADGSETVLRVQNAATGETREFVRLPDATRVLSWSPDGTLVLTGNTDRIELHNVADGTPAGSIGINWDDTIGGFTASGHVVHGSSSRQTWVQLPGWFCTDPIALVAPRHVFGAIARDAGGNTSLPAAPIEMRLASSSLPDLAIGASDLFWVPADAAPGDRVGALATVRNAGAARAPASALRADLVAPDGTSRLIVLARPVAALEPGAATSVDLDLGVLAQAGTYRLRVSLDPGGAIVEASETNNVAESRLTLTAAGEPLVEVTPDRALFAPGEVVTGSVSVANLDAAARLRVAAVDAAGTVVDPVGDFAVGPVAPGTAWTQRVEWPAAGVVAGDYRLRARLTDAGGNLIAERYAPVTIGALRNIELRVEPDAALVTAGGVVRVRSAVGYVEGNVAIEGARLRLVAVAPDGAERTLAERSLGTLLTGYELHDETLWNTTGVAAGTHGLRLRLTAPGLDRAAEASVTIEAPGAHVAIAGSLALAPADSLVAGQGSDLRYTLANRGDTVLTGVQARLRVTAAGSGAAVAQVERTLDLAPGADVADLLALAAPPLALTTHLAVLEVRLPGDAAGTWRVLARRSFDVVDGLPPEITLATPATNVLQPAVVPLRVGIVDAHSVVALAQVRVDAGAWQPLTRGEDGWYARGLAGLADGEHALVVRARDTWGNEATSERRAFTVDATAPVIAISGVSDGDVATQPVTPVVTVTEANPATTEIRLNGDAFVSGTTVTAEGEYVLAVRATDRAGNLALRTLRFRIDTTAPPIAIVEPADGATVSQSHIGVAVQTGAGAVVDLAVGAWHGQVTADDAGLARFTEVPLAVGDNVIEARARDAAGNPVGPVSVHVTFVPPTGAGISGTVQPSQTELPYGGALSVAVRARNNTGSTLAAQKLRVRATATTVLGEETLVHDFAIGETVATTVDFASSSWALGTVVVTLEHDVTGGGTWIELDRKTVTVVDRAAPFLDSLSPAGNGVLRGPVVIRARAVDVPGGVAAVDASLDNENWFVLAPDTAAPDYYHATAPALADGDYRYFVRARDTAGNLISAAPVSFAIDTVPPTITIDGIPAEVAKGPVLPLFSIDDRHFAEQSFQLNGAPYTPNMPIDASGDYTLLVAASDRAGNRAEARADFTIDNDAPTVGITAPSDGSTVETPSVTLAGTTEAGAKVAVSIDTFGATVFADAGGVFGVEGVPLSEGANTIRVQATDRAGNVGAPVDVHVTYQASATATLDGLMTPPLLVPTGSQPWPVGYLLRNTGLAAAANQPMRVVVRRNGADAATTPFTVTIPPLGLDAGEVRVAFGGLSPGVYSVYLEAWQARPGHPPAWAVLDLDLTTVYRGCHHGRTVEDALFGDGFDEGAADDDTLFCYGFDSDASVDAASNAPAPWLSFRESYAYVSRPLPSGAP